MKHDPGGSIELWQYTPNISDEPYFSVFVLLELNIVNRMISYYLSPFPMLPNEVWPMANWSK